VGVFIQTRKCAVVGDKMAFVSIRNLSLNHFRKKTGKKYLIALGGGGFTVEEAARWTWKECKVISAAIT
jgi:hypothetical protein